MPPRQLRRRSQARTQAEKKKPSEQQPEQPAAPSPSFFDKLKPYLFFAGRNVHIGIIGLLCAASLTHHAATVTLFLSSLGAMLFVLLRVFISILQSPDRTPLQMPTVHYADGTIKEPEPITVHDHDHKIATYFASEMPAFAVATAWMYMWVGTRPVVLINSLYYAYRFMYHPLFRIHLWKEPDCPEFERPFGGVPLFRKNDTTSRVKVVTGKAEYDRALRAAAGKLIVADFSATWCGPCRAIAPKFKEIAEEFKGSASFLTVDVDHSQDVAAQENISSIPTFIFFRDLERLEMMRGATPEKLREAIRRHS